MFRRKDHRSHWNAFLAHSFDSRRGIFFDERVRDFSLDLLSSRKRLSAPLASFQRQRIGRPQRQRPSSSLCLDVLQRFFLVSLFPLLPVPAGRLAPFQRSRRRTEKKKNHRSDLARFNLLQRHGQFPRCSIFFFSTPLCQTRCIGIQRKSLDIAENARTSKR